MRFLILFSALIFILILQSCRENVIEFPEEENTGIIYIDSTPLGASIFLNESDTDKITPDRIENLSPGNYSITLKLEGYSDTTVTIPIAKGDTPYLSIRLR